jgi:glucose-6-phosphate-specific signal transduction histidine kinase
VRIEDDGKGFMPARSARGLGLIGIEERVAEMGGVLELNSKPGAGTRIFISIPLQKITEPQGGPADSRLPQAHENPIG